MRIAARHTPILVFLVSSLMTSNASDGPLSNGLNPAGSVQAARSITEVVPGAGGNVKLALVGTEHAPVDGRDGMPHEGPFVETGAERTRKNQLADDEEIVMDKTTKKQYSDVEIPKSNDAVMDDRIRSNPAEGTRGTEGGISEKGKDGKSSDKKPDAPKDARPIPHSELDKIQDGEKKESQPAEEDPKKILKIPTDLPEKPHDIPYPENPSSPKDATILKDTSKGAKSDDHEPAVIQPLHSLLLSFTMILFSEIGDKTFLVAALMAMRHPRVVVFSSAYSALVTMTVLSAVLGHAVPTLISKQLTNFAAAGLFLVFGVKMLIEARGISPDEGVSEEMKEVEMELEEKEHQQRRMSRRRSSISPYALESGRAGLNRKHTNSRLPSPPESPGSSREASPTRQSALKNAVTGINNLFSLLLSPAWVQTFVMTFLGEWGDRSQIATIAMAAGQDYWWVTAGALGGHAICTAAAVLGGKAIAGKVSLRTVTMGGAIAFLVFGVIYLLEAVY
ncbi:uncharacterized protein A1O9_06406 [Exophiala aquamarina CBS 119918]|uniref:GDT1 family protein n=1 Tax=Exophiala aquamarina CBS 119918 TaxID=1182545 RepID=A0A072PSH5_9EURO|nr:uncharacterized protein A1O9_06406 [Exophiala aquamarina CBS 119918]KEF58480.1 hypothetical protein A1O9_06406 [Exophiala aquamarina CBS 119918]